MVSNTNTAKDDSVAKLKSAANELNDDLQYAAHKAGSKIRSIYNNAHDELHHASDVVTSEIRSNPIRSSVVALGVGVILGALLRR
ncbi:MAG: hypothetical protein V4735_02005 [Pseudomonadota bacterium]